jgi:hypothetical protein
VSTPQPDHDNLVALRRRTTEAIRDLHRIRSNDPAACRAIHVVRLTEHTLEAHWLPALDASIEAR